MSELTYRQAQLMARLRMWGQMTTYGQTYHGTMRELVKLGIAEPVGKYTYRIRISG